MTRRYAHFVRSCLLAVVYTACTYSSAHADWAQSLGIGQKSTNLGSAVSATSDDYDAFYTNPAGAAEFIRPFMGFGIKTIDTRGLSVQQTDVTSPSLLQSGAYYFLDALGQDSLADLFTPGADGLDLSPERTLPKADIGIIPSFGAYMPVPGMENVVIGVGSGTPFLVSAEYGNKDAPGNYGKFNTTGAGLIIVETSPSIAVKVNDKLNVGASVGVTTFKYLKVSNELGAPDLGTGSLGSVNLQTDSTVTIPGIEPSFATDPTSVSYTLGMQYKITPKLTAGVTYRSETPETFEGTASVSVNKLGLETGWSAFDSWASIGPYDFKDKFKYDVELPAHLQAGLAYKVTPKWTVMADARWTNWSNAKGFGTPSEIFFKDGTVDPGGAISEQHPFLSKIVGIKSAPINSITVDYNAHDTVSLHFGTAYKLTDQLEIQAGYIYDPSAMPDDTVDLITFSSDRHIFSLGGTYTLPTDNGVWAFTLGGQFVQYEDRHISANTSKTLGGIDGLSAILSNETDLKYTTNSLGGIDIGGYVWSGGASVSYQFGAPSQALEK